VDHGRPDPICPVRDAVIIKHDPLLEGGGSPASARISAQHVGEDKMNGIRGRFKLLAVLAAGAVAVGLGTGFAAPLAAAARDVTNQFGFTAVRSGIPEGASRFDLTSPDLQNNRPFTQSEIANIFGCHGGNQAPRLRWSGAPAATQSFAVTMFDPDAPTGSGFWHWLTWDIPAGVTSLDGALPAGVVSGTNDAGLTGYLGPCPPPGDRTHRYRLTVFALDVPSLGLPATTRGAVVAFSMRLHILAFGRLVATFSQPA
jgi:Raf kinase inhibitor-like YbhB/YbcL family protein